MDRSPYIIITMDYILYRCYITMDYILYILPWITIDNQYMDVQWIDNPSILFSHPPVDGKVEPSHLMNK